MIADTKDMPPVTNVPYGCTVAGFQLKNGAPTLETLVSALLKRRDSDVVDLWQIRPLLSGAFELDSIVEYNWSWRWEK